ncbi:MAG: helix-turn-helix domain-containing protein [Pedobacter sp.]
MKKIGETIPNALDRIKERAIANKGYECEGFYFTVNYMTARGGYIKQIGPRAFGVFAVIRTFMNKDKISFPELKTIRTLTGLNIGTIRKDISILEKYGWLRKIVKRNNKGQYEVSHYLILQTDLVRGTGNPSYRKKPISRFNNGL